MATNIARNNPMVMASLEKNIFEHISLMSQEQVELEYREELQQLQQIQQMMQQNPQMAQQMQIQLKMLTEKIEGRKAVLIAEMMEVIFFSSFINSSIISAINCAFLASIF